MTTNDYAEHVAASLRALAGDERLAELDLVIEQRIVDGDELVTRYHLLFDGGPPRVVEGGADAADVVLTLDQETADTLRRGDSHAHRAFLTGRLRLEGDIDALLSHGGVLAGLVATLGRTDA